ncbi:MAG: hypothetical protein NZO16_06830 [Deltaproteobacteria bacterium]|nr:hypothetical protein [Deltaproteobacteria bacterium]
MKSLIFLFFFISVFSCATFEQSKSSNIRFLGTNSSSLQEALKKGLFVKGDKVFLRAAISFLHDTSYSVALITFTQSQSLVENLTQNLGESGSVAQNSFNQKKIINDTECDRQVINGQSKSQQAVKIFLAAEKKSCDKVKVIVATGKFSSQAPSGLKSRPKLDFVEINPQLINCSGESCASELITKARIIIPEDFDHPF